MSSLLSITNLTKRFADKVALSAINLEVPTGEIVCLLGPSGCGKTTLLRIVAGLETFDAGALRCNRQDLTEVPPHQRDFGLMFQDYALFPHKNVFDNVAFGLKMQAGGSNVRFTNIEQRVREMLALVGLAGFEQRSVNDLSGGEAQRVALARSLAPRPRLLMLDEPLGSLDRALRERLMLELRDILKAVGVTTLYVTHDQTEAFAIADQVVVMNEGRIEQIGEPEKIYRQPVTTFVAKFLGLSNLGQGQVTEQGNVETEWGTLTTNTEGYQIGERLNVLIRPEVATILPPTAELDDYPLNLLSGCLTTISFRGGRYQIQVQPDQGLRLTFEISGVLPFSLEAGQPLKLVLDPAGIVLFG